MLKNRFNKEELARTWTFWFRCLWCDKSGVDSFHHIKSPSSQDYQKGDFNKSMLNSYPIHNFRHCHLYNPLLHKKETESRLLKKVLKVLLENGYKLTHRDRRFMEVYKDSYVDNSHLVEK